MIYSKNMMIVSNHFNIKIGWSCKNFGQNFHKFNTISTKCVDYDTFKNSFKEIHLIFDFRNKNVKECYIFWGWYESCRSWCSGIHARFPFILKHFDWIEISAPQKGWTGPACVGIAMMSSRARELLDKEEPSSTSFCCNLKKWSTVMEKYEAGGFMYYTTLPTDSLMRFRNVLLETEK